MQFSADYFEDGLHQVNTLVLQLFASSLVKRKIPLTETEALKSVGDALKQLRERLFAPPWMRLWLWLSNPSGIRIEWFWTTVAVAALFGMKHRSYISVEKEVREFERLMIGKQMDYGPRNIMIFGELGVLVRITDKYERLNNLLHSGRAPKNEAIADTWADLYNYAVIAIMLNAGIFDKPMRGV